MSLRQYNVDLSDVAEWLPWGGLTLPHVLENKNGSMLSVIRYTSLKQEAVPIKTPRLMRGWSIWVEKQRHQGESVNYLVICWNPFVSGSTAGNTLGKPVKSDRTLEYFGKAVLKIRDAVAEVTGAELLEYQDIIDYLSFTLSIGLRKWEMPEIPLYLDVYLSQDLGLSFTENEIRMKNMRYLVCSVLGTPNLDAVYKGFSALSYRHVRRLLCMDVKQGRKDMLKYTSSWCPGRKYVKKAIYSNLVEGDICGYLSEYFIFLLDENNYSSFRAFAENLLSQKHISYRLEEFFFKDIWWGSLPGIYQADLNPPIQFFRDLGWLMEHEPAVKKAKEGDTGPRIQFIRLRKGGEL